MFFPFIVLGIIIGLVWQSVLKQEKFIINVHNEHKLIFGLCASLADKYKSNVWVVRLGMFFILNVGYLVMYLLLDKSENQSPSAKIKSTVVKFDKKDDKTNSKTEEVKIEIE